MKNNFEILCQLASKNNWCWTIGCTTCGCWDIRAGFYAIAKDIDLINIESIKIKENYRDLNYSDANKIINIVSEANLDVIKKDCKFPDWLGYIGLVFNLIVPIVFPFDREKLLEAFCPQFISMLHPSTNAYKSINTIIESNYSIPFHISLLEEIESAINRN